MKSLLLTAFPLCTALAGSHVQVSIRGSSYSHGAKVEQSHPSLASVSAYTTAAPIIHKQDTIYLTEAPSHPTDAPAHQNTASMYNSEPLYHSKIKYNTEPQQNTALEYHTEPQDNTEPMDYTQPQYHTQPLYYTQPKDPTESQYYTEPQHHTQYHNELQYHTVQDYQTPKQNCSVIDEVVKAKVCTPALNTKCASVDFKVKSIIDKEQCQDITRTVCSSIEEVIENKICVYSHEKESKDTVAKTIEVTYAKECTTQRVTVCQPAQGHSYHSYGQPQQYCKEEDQETCYNVPKVTAVDTKVSVIYPSPIKTCSNKPITILKISCEDIVKEKCITVPDVKEETEKVEKCEVSLAEPKCQYIDLTLPKQVCVGLVYRLGHAVELTAKQYHAKVL